MIKLPQDLSIDKNANADLKYIEERERQTELLDFSSIYLKYNCFIF